MIHFSIRRPWVTLFLWILVVVGVSAGMYKITMDPDVTGDLPENLPEKKLYDRVGKMFPSREFVFLAVVPRDKKDPFSADVIWQVHQLTEAIRDIPEVQDVQSPTNAQIIEGRVGGFHIRTAGKPLPVTPAQVARFRRDLLGQEQFEGTVIAKDKKAFGIMVFFKNKVQETKAAGKVLKLVEKKLAAFRALKKLPPELAGHKESGHKESGRKSAPAPASASAVSPTSSKAPATKKAPPAFRQTPASGQGPTASKQASSPQGSSKAAPLKEVRQDSLRQIDVYAAGRPAVSYMAGATMGKEMGILSSLAIVVIMILLFVTFRTGRGVALPLCVVVGASLVTLGAMSWVGIGITHATQMLPILIISIGVADGIHLMKFYYIHARGEVERATVVTKVMKDMAPPVIMTSLTTAAGFLALNTAGLPSVSILGISTAFGVLIAMFLSISLLPALLMVLPIPRKLRQFDTETQSVLSERVMGGWSRFLLKRRVAVLALLGLLLLVMGLGLSQLHAEMSVLSNFKPGHPIRQSGEVINKHFMGGSSMQIVFEGPQGFLLDPAFLQRVQKLEKKIKKMEKVGGVLSAILLIKWMNQVLSDGRPEAYRLPQKQEERMGQKIVEEKGEEKIKEYKFMARGRDIIRDYLNAFALQSRRGVLDNMITPERDAFKLTVFFKTDKQSVQRAVLQKIRDELKLTFRTATTEGSLPPQAQGKVQTFPKVKAEVTGMTVLILAVTGRLVRGQSLSILVSLFLVFLLTSIMFRSPVLGFFNVLPLAGTLMINFGIMGLSGIPINEITIAVSSVAIGVGVDYGLHFVHRVRHKMAETTSYHEAIRAAFQDSGVAIVFNALTVAAGFATIMAASFQGLVIMSFLLTLTMIASAFGALTVLPVIFAVFQPRSLRKHLDRPQASTTEEKNR